MAIGTPYLVVLAGSVVTTATTLLQETVTATTTAGDCITAFCANSNSVPTGCSDSKGNIYVQEITESVAGFKLYGYVAAYGSGGSGTATAALVSGTDWIKFTFASTGVTNTSLILGAMGCSGIVNTTPVDAAGTLAAGVTVASTSPAVTGGTTLAQASEWIVTALFAGSASGTPSGWSDAFTSFGTLQPLSGSDWLTVASEVVSATTAQDAACTITSAKWGIVQVALMAASGGGTNASAGLAAATGVPLASPDSVTLNMTIQGV
jgi:hypothetical protein